MDINSELVLFTVSTLPGCCIWRQRCWLMESGLQLTLQLISKVFCGIQVNRSKPLFFTVRFILNISKCIKYHKLTINSTFTSLLLLIYKYSTIQKVGVAKRSLMLTKAAFIYLFLFYFPESKLWFERLKKLLILLSDAFKRRVPEKNALSNIRWDVVIVIILMLFS